ncbi:MAG: NAD(P)H-binding protein [Thermoprotei archaeon]
MVVAGSTGFVGSNTVKHFSLNGVEARALVRNGANARRKAASIKDAGASDVRVVNFDSGKDLVEAMNGCDLLIHLAGTASQTVSNPFHTSNNVLTELLVNSAVKAGVRRIIYNSGLGVGDENTLGYFVSKLECEKIVENSGLEYLIFRPSYIVGPGDEFSKFIYSSLKNNTPVPVFGSGEYRMQPVHVGDVVKVYLRASRAGVWNRVFDLVGPQKVSFTRYVSMVAEAFGVKPVFKQVDLEQALRDSMMPASKRKVNPDYSVDELMVLISDFTSSHRQVSQAFGVKFRGLKEIVTSLVEFMRKQTS